MCSGPRHNNNNNKSSKNRKRNSCCLAAQSARLTPAQQLCDSFFFFFFWLTDIPPQPGVFGLMRLKSLSGTAGCEWRQLCVSHRAETTRGLQIQTKCRSILFCAVNVSLFLTPRTRPLTHFICRLYREYLYM